MALEIRPANLGDVAAVLHLWRAAEAESTHTDDPQSLERLIAWDRAALVLGTDGGVVVGSVIAGWDGWRGSIYRLVVHPGHRRTGMGRLLLDAAEARLASVGAVRSQATVVSSDPQAMGFWRSTDWREQVDRSRFVAG